MDKNRHCPKTELQSIAARARAPRTGGYAGTIRAMKVFDIAVIGAGAAGMMCAAVAGQSGRRVVLVDHASRLAEKIRISGGGRCNFTNLHAGPANYLSANPHFCRSALARYTPRDFLALLKRYRVSWHEKHKGQLFCDQSSDAVIDVLKNECEAGQVSWRRPLEVSQVRRREGAGFILDTPSGPIEARALVIATGGLSIPKIGATDFAFRVARQFGHKLVDTRPALVPLTFAASDWAPFAALAGVSMEVQMATGKGRNGAEFIEDLLFTHRGLSGPGVLQISSYWQPGEPVQVNLLPERDAVQALLEAKTSVRRNLANLLAEWLPGRVADTWLATHGVPAQARVADLPDKTLRHIGAALSCWSLTPNGTEGYRKAEVTRGGVDTRELSSTTMMSARVPGLYFIGEAVDVTGWLGGYNFQWAWASGVAAGEAAAEYTRSLSSTN